MPKVDPIGRYVAEFMSGYRCLVCSSVRDQHGQCDHQRAEQFQDRQFEAELFLRTSGASPDHRGSNLLYGATSSALKRASLQAGQRETRHQDVMADHRGRTQGKVIEWQPHKRPSGDELPL